MVVIGGGRAGARARRVALVLWVYGGEAHVGEFAGVGGRALGRAADGLGFRYVILEDVFEVSG